VSLDAEPPRETTERLFFALWPDEAQRSALAHATRKMVSRCGGRPVSLDSLHVTLVFLGSIPVKRIPEIRVIGHRVAMAMVERPTLTFDLLEHWARPQVLCAASSAPSPAVAALAGLLRMQTEQGGFSPDLRPFREHVTVARKVVHPTQSRLLHTVTWTAASFALMASRTESTGPVYSIVESYPLDELEAP
jgi:2'-5' RNA ligase